MVLDILGIMKVAEENEKRAAEQAAAAIREARAREEAKKAAWDDIFARVAKSIDDDNRAAMEAEQEQAAEEARSAIASRYAERNPKAWNSATASAYLDLARQIKFQS